MSYDVHESYCLDSFMSHLLFDEDFEGDTIKDLWNVTLVGGGTAVVVDQQTGGIVRLSTPTASDTVTLDWNDIRSLHVDQKVTIEARVRCNGGVTDTSRKILALWFDGNNHLEFYHGVDSTDIRMRNIDDGGSNTASTNITVDTDWHIYRIECHTHGSNHIHYYIDEVECANSPRTSNIPDDATDYLQPYFYIDTNADTDPATSMDVDYVYIRQDRV